MADPKFANLPGIAYDQPDVYETADVADQETSDYYDEEPANESIERLHISTKDSFNKFKGKYLTGHVDFSDSLSKRLRTGYDARYEFTLLLLARLRSEEEILQITFSSLAENRFELM
ncbi:Dynactin subunit 2 [Pseudolycoriella hygida]|uniref:Dynactin subunit 2 n=1 Tax=Pseudolycoriella hygida TaxID=35572 RepID=A0A9Q0S6N7_9DIPT|nr:Dynactin subunit 2 [Pseudolycoriella hygida]